MVKNLFYANAKNTVEKYNIKGLVVSNIGNIQLLNELYTNLNKHFKIIANYTFNVFNSHSVLELKKCKTAKDFIKLLTKIHLENGIQIDNYIKDYKLVDLKFIDYERFKRIN